jgi:uncharacterized membrane protein YfcA
MPLALLFTLLATGLAIGFISGLLGIGGGVIMTPVQIWLYSSLGWSPDVVIKVTFATSLAVILPTAASGVWRHQKHHDINWKAAVVMGLCTSVCSFIGASLATKIPGDILKIVFGGLTLLIAVRMLLLKVNDEEHPVRQNIWLWIAIAVPVGLITGLLGIGGGVLVIPALVLFLKFRVREAAATSLGIMLFTSVGGIAGYIYNGMQATGLPDFTLGYIYWPAWIALSITSIVMAQVGAIAAHKLPGKQLNYIFIALLFYISLDMLGVIDWIAGWF